MEISKKLSDSDPTNASKREYTDEAFYWVGFFLERKGDLSQALLSYRRSLADFQALASTDPNEVRTRQYVGMCEKGIGTVLVARGQTIQGLESIRKGLHIFEDLPNPGNEQYVADAYGSMGSAYAGLAAKSGVPISARLENLREAHAAYEKSFDKWLAAKSRGTLTIFSADEPDRIKNELAACDVALTRLAPRTPQ